MANATTIAKAIIEVGATGVDAAKDEIQSLEARVAALGDEYAKDQITISEYAKRTDQLRGQMKSLEEGIRLATDASAKYKTTQEAVASLQATTTVSTKNYQQSALAASYALQDFASANGGLVQQLASVNNNIPQIVAGLGGPTGMVAAVSALTTVVVAAAPAVYNYAKSLGVLGDEADTVKGKIEKLNERIKELEDKPVKIAVDSMELDNLRRKLREIQNAEQAFEQFRSTKSEDEKRAGDETEQLLAMAPGGAGALAERLARSMGQQLLANDPKLQDLRRTIDEQTQKAAEFEAAARASMGVGKAGVAAQQGKDARAAAEAAKAAQQAFEIRQREILGDNITGERGEAHGEVGKMFRGATSGGDQGARDRLVAELRKIDEKTLADEIAATNARSVAAAKAEEQEERNENSRLETNNAIRDIRKQRKVLADKEAREAEQAQVDKARPVISGIVKGRDLETTATKILEDLENNKAVGPDGKPMGAQQQLEFLQEQIRGVIEEELKARGLLNKGSGRAASATATQIAAAARTNLDRAAEKAKTKMDSDLQKEISQAAGAFGPKINDELQAAVLNRMSRGQQDAAIQRDLSKQLSQRMAGAGVNDPRVAEQAAAQIVEKVLGGLRLDLQTEGPSVQEAAQNRLSDLLRKVQGQRRNAGNARQTEALAQDIEANSFAELGVQFSPEQSQAAAKKAVELAGQGVNANAALQMALQEQLGAMNALGNQLMQQSGMLQQFAQEFQMIRRGIQTRQRTAGKRG